MEPTAQFEDIDIPLSEAVHGRDSVRGVLGIPEWWPTGERVAVVFAHGGAGNFEDPIITTLARTLTEKSYMTLRFNFPFIEAGKAVFNVEYGLETKEFCAQARELGFNSLRKNLDVDAWRESCD